MRARLLAGGIAAALAFLAISPAGAGAEPGAPALLSGVTRLNDMLALMGQPSNALELPPNQALSELRFKNRDGYTISGVAFGQTVVLSVARARAHPGRGPDGVKRKVRDRVSATSYLVHGRGTPASISASFGDRGRIALRFHPSGREVRATRKAGCTKPGKEVIARLGVFSGRLRFEGEGSYTSADVHRIRGRLIDTRALFACLFGLPPGKHASLPSPRSSLGVRLPGRVAAYGAARSVPSVPTYPSTRPKLTSLVADGKQPLARTVFAAQVRGKARARFLALSELSEGSIGILRLAYARGARSTFFADPTLSSAVAKPPPPFGGVGTLQHGPDGTKTWSGSLAVSFLGAPQVPLTGPPFRTWLSRGF